MVHEELIQRDREDVYPVRSRVSWGAIFAGAAVTFTLWILLSSLGAAVGLSVGDAGQIGQGVGIYAIIVSFLCLFLGGWVTSQCVAGERKLEAGVYGLMLWGVFFLGILWLGMSGLELGLSSAAALGGQQQQAQVPIGEEQVAQSASAAWWTFGVIAVSIVSAVLGALAGSGRRAVFRRRRVETTGTVAGAR